jgi:translation initiation factor 2B subunit (eIF-2B alpha/beta/delta family)
MAGLLSAWTEATVMDDDRAVRELPAEAVVVGADAVTPTSVINKVRTRDLVAAAAQRGLPCYTIAATTKLVPLELPAPEPFEATPLELFTRVATSSGLLLPEEVEDRARQVRLHPVLPMLLERLDGP